MRAFDDSTTDCGGAVQPATTGSVTLQNRTRVLVSASTREKRKKARRRQASRRALPGVCAPSKVRVDDRNLRTCVNRWLGYSPLASAPNPVTFVPTQQISSAGSDGPCPTRATTLSRVVRIALTSRAPTGRSAHNTFAGFPSTNELPLWTEFRVEVFGNPDAGRGYVTSVAQIDAATRAAVESELNFSCASVLNGTATPHGVLSGIALAVGAHLGHPVARLTWLVSPYHHYSWEQSMPQHTTLSCQFEFAAAHRLNDPSLSEAENIALFGKCNRLNGHGHNYRLEVGITPPADRPMGMAEFERMVATTVVDRFDHKNLNVDCPEFASLNPTVEHIAQVCFELLEPECAAASVELRRVTVWETSKTSATVER